MFLAALGVQARVCTSTGSGNWEDAATWTCPGGPAAGDTIYILPTHTVQVNTNITYAGAPMLILVQGTWHFEGSGSKISLPCGSSVIITGSLTTTASGGGSSQTLKICGVTYWKRSDGPITGPQYFPGALPVEILNFEANANGDVIEIVWSTASEINSESFVVERSSDATNWETLVTSEAAGNSRVTISYEETDFSPLEGVSYYRLKQIDINGEYSYSSIVPVKFYKEKSLEMNLFPNPVQAGSNVSVDIPQVTNKEVLVVLRDMVGRTFYSKIVLSMENDHLIGIPIDSKIPKGNYLITATSDDQIYSKQLIVK